MMGVGARSKRARSSVETDMPCSETAELRHTNNIKSQALTVNL